MTEKITKVSTQLNTKETRCLIHEITSDNDQTSTMLGENRRDV